MLHILALDLVAIAFLTAAYAVHPAIAVLAGMVVGFPMAVVTAVSIRVGTAQLRDHGK
jgi:hypothetical protein